MSNPGWHRPTEAATVTDGANVVAMEESVVWAGVIETDAERTCEHYTAMELPPPELLPQLTTLPSDFLAAKAKSVA